jgi:hypothetical protein
VLQVVGVVNLACWLGVGLVLTMESVGRDGPRRYDIFLSYRKTADKALVVQLHEKLRANGFEVFFDERELEDAGRWESQFHR